jgi:hypothetical protein
LLSEALTFDTVPLMSWLLPTPLQVASDVALLPLVVLVRRPTSPATWFGVAMISAGR